MMHADLVDMVDFVNTISDLGIQCSSNEPEKVKSSIELWLKDNADNAPLWDAVYAFESDGILLPEVEEVIAWTLSKKLAA
ncbi:MULTISPECIES: hypothetical protein [Vibrio]|uniref:Uncharacterized protein n=2 Tax=Vibrio TaxID=662 RepID=A0A7X4LM39_9VIBR|nr:MULTISPECIES: hypothetical protein [Vibrio]MBF9000955.1 hypothetical protein [Vibrio nitrifigilis]MZI94454.1 hypothetical protein [Vibrio eleionomae]